MKIFEQVAQFTKELAVYIKKGMPNVSGKCGCNMTAKAKWATSNCPEKKWPEIKKK